MTDLVTCPSCNYAFEIDRPAGAVLDLVNLTLSERGFTVSLPEKQAAALSIIAQAAPRGEVVPRWMLAETLYSGGSVVGADSNARKLLTLLRRRIAGSSLEIVNVRGRGVRLVGRLTVRTPDMERKS